MENLLEIELDMDEKVGAENDSAKYLNASNIDIIESDMSDYEEDLLGLESQLHNAVVIYAKLEDEIANDKLIYESQMFTLGTESIVSVYEDALFELDITDEEIEPIVGLEHAQNDAEKFLVGIEAKDSLLTKISIKIRQFIKAITRVLRKLADSSAVYLSTVTMDIAKLADKVDELDDEEGVILKGGDSEASLKKRIKKIMNFYLTTEASEFAPLTPGGEISQYSTNSVVRAMEVLENNIRNGYQEKNFDSVKFIYDSYVDNRDKKNEDRPTDSIQKKSKKDIDNYIDKLGSKAFPTNSKVRKLLAKHTKDTILFTSVIRPDKLTTRLLVDYKKKGSARKWVKVSAEQNFRTNNVDFENITNTELKHISATAQRIVTNYDLSLLVTTTFDILKDLDDDLAEMEARRKGNPKKLDRLRSIVDYTNAIGSDYIFAALANNKSMYRLLRTLVTHTDTVVDNTKGS